MLVAWRHTCIPLCVAAHVLSVCFAVWFRDEFRHAHVHTHTRAHFTHPQPRPWRLLAAEWARLWRLTLPPLKNLPDSERRQRRN